MPVQFDPKIHLAYAPPESRITMEELGKAGEGISPIGATQAFPLLTEEAVLALREELFTPRVRERCSFATPRAPCQLRGLSCRPGFAPFNEALWTHPETIRAVSDAVGMELVPIMRYELGHANVQANPGEDTLSKMKREPLRGEVSAVRQESVIPSFENLPSMVADDTDSEDEADLRSPVSQGDKKLEPAIAGHSPPKPNGVELQKEDQHTPVVGWHRDSYPWSCIVMLSDASTMQGGETAVACADKSVKKILGPKMGWAMMVQGRYIDHSALRAYGPERVTMVTSYRAKDVTIPDDSILSPLRAKGHRNEMIYDWATYRLDLLSERFKLQSDALKKKRGDGQGPWGEEIVNKGEFKAWCQEQIKYLQTTIDGMD